jgi:acylphosphatase
MDQIKRIIIKGGKVHNVGYRPFLLAKARRLRIPNYEADNVEEEGKQMVIVSVGGVEKQVQEFVEFVKENYPKKANVSGIWVDPNPPESVMPLDEYDKILAAEQQNTVIQTGLEMVGLQKQTVGIQKQTVDMQKQTVDMQKQTVDMQKQTVDMQKQTIEEIKTVGEKIDLGFEKTDQDFSTLREDYGKISQTMEEILDRLTQQQKEFTEAINGLTNAILKLAEKSA